MPLLTSDLENAYKLALFIDGERRTPTESYLLTSTTWDNAKLVGKHIANWRAAVLATDFTLTYAVVSKLGPNKNSDVVITTPIAGGKGVKFPTADGYTEDSMKGNNPGVCARFRFQTSDRLHVTRGFRGLPDEAVKKFKLAVTTPDQPDLGTFSADYALTDDSLPYNNYWPADDSTPPVDAASFITWFAALKKFLNVVYRNTQYGKVVPGIGGANGTLQNAAWADLIYRRLGERSSPLPIGR